MRVEDLYALSFVTNMGSLWTQNALEKRGQVSAIGQTRLATGLKVNTAVNDAAGASMTSKLIASIIGTKRGSQNAGDMKGAQGTLVTAHGSINDMLFRMKDLALQSANGTCSSSDRALMDVERAAFFF